MGSGSSFRSTCRTCQSPIPSQPVSKHMRISKPSYTAYASLLLALALGSCSSAMSTTSASNPLPGGTDAAQRLARYSSVRLAPDVSALTDNERRMIPLLIDAAKAMDEVFWIQAYGDRS